MLGWREGRREGGGEGQVSGFAWSVSRSFLWALWAIPLSFGFTGQSNANKMKPFDRTLGREWEGGGKWRENHTMTIMCITKTIPTKFFCFNCKNLPSNHHYYQEYMTLVIITINLFYKTNLIIIAAYHFPEWHLVTQAVSWLIRIYWLRIKIRLRYGPAHGEQNPAILGSITRTSGSTGIGDIRWPALRGVAF